MLNKYLDRGKEKKSLHGLFYDNDDIENPYINILNCALQHHWHIITPALAELPIGTQLRHFKE